MSRLLSRDQVRRVDQLAVERYGISSLILMENAGRNAAAIIDAHYGPRAAAFVLCGPGNNGGDGCVIARHLHNAGWSVRLLMTAPESRWTPDTLSNHRIVEAMGLRPVVAEDEQAQMRATGTISAGDIVIDALLGTGFTGAVRAPLDGLITAVNSVPKRAAVSVDVPSGLDCDSGAVGGVAIRADLTITFVGVKRGFVVGVAPSYVGRVEVADIGAPRELIEDISSTAV